MNNIRPFASEYIEITIPLSDDGIALLEERNPEALHDYHSALDSTNAESVSCEVKVAFDMANKQTLFFVNVVEQFNDVTVPSTETGTWIELDKETAEYFQKEAISKVMNCSGTKCRCDRTEAPIDYNPNDFTNRIISEETIRVYFKNK